LRRTLLRWLLASLALAAVPALAQEISDDEIHDQVLLKLARDTTVQGGAIEVEVKMGAVTLRGKVRTTKARDKAEKLAKSVKGVKSVDNKLTISPSAH